MNHITKFASTVSLTVVAVGAFGTGIAFAGDNHCTSNGQPPSGSAQGPSNGQSGCSQAPTNPPKPAPKPKPSPTHVPPVKAQPPAARPPVTFIAKPKTPTYRATAPAVPAPAPKPIATKAPAPKPVATKAPERHLAVAPALAVAKPCQGNDLTRSPWFWVAMVLGLGCAAGAAKIAKDRVAAKATKSDCTQLGAENNHLRALVTPEHAAEAAAAGVAAVTAGKVVKARKAKATAASTTGVTTTPVRNVHTLGSVGGKVLGRMGYQRIEK